MKKELAPEDYNYNKFPGPQFQKEGDQIRANDLLFYLKVNEKEAFDVQDFSNRFSELLLKYDYIVGDWSQEQLRLKGFYQMQSKSSYQQSIDTVKDYLLEYCPFGCAYFILENPNPKEVVFKEEKLYKTRKRRKRPSYKSARFKDEEEEYSHQFVIRKKR